MKMALSEDDCNFLMYALEGYNPEGDGEYKVNDLHRRVLNLRSLIWKETEKPTEALVELMSNSIAAADDLVPIVELRNKIVTDNKFPYYTTQKIQIRRQGYRDWEDVPTVGEI